MFTEKSYMLPYYAWILLMLQKEWSSTVALRAHSLVGSHSNEKKGPELIATAVKHHSWKMYEIVYTSVIKNDLLGNHNVPVNIHYKSECSFNHYESYDQGKWTFLISRNPI